MSLPLNLPSSSNATGVTLDTANHVNAPLDPLAHLSFLHRSPLFNTTNDIDETTTATAAATTHGLDLSTQPPFTKRSSFLTGTLETASADSSAIPLQPYSAADLLTTLAAAAQVSLPFPSPVQAQLPTPGITDELSPDSNPLGLHFLQSSNRTPDINTTTAYNGHINSNGGMGDVESDLGSLSGSGTDELDPSSFENNPARKKRRQEAGHQKTTITATVTTTVPTDPTKTIEPSSDTNNGNSKCSASARSNVGSGNNNRVLTPEEKRERNRQAQRAFRERRERYVQQLEFMVRELQSQRDTDMNALQLENASLRQMLGEAGREIARLRPGSMTNNTTLSRRPPHIHSSHPHLPSTAYTTHPHTPIPSQQQSQQQQQQQQQHQQQKRLQSQQPSQPSYSGYHSAPPQPLHQTHPSIPVSSPAVENKTVAAAAAAVTNTRNLFPHTTATAALPTTMHGATYYAGMQSGPSPTTTSSNLRMATATPVDSAYNNERTHPVPSAGNPLPLLQPTLGSSLANWFLEDWNPRQDSK